MAPEISGQCYAPKPLDMWALGITVFVLLFGKFPYDIEQTFGQTDTHLSALAISRKVTNYDLVFPELPVIPDELQTVLAKLLARSPTERATAQMIVDHPWLREQVEEYKRIWSYIGGDNHLLV
jgi:serine/threonine protein kinase